uniref:Uncharacterized protein n=1 Tax=Amphimedon queenslandica TaxID=400682 RepID=A0A1X7VGK4_AMPQE
MVSGEKSYTPAGNIHAPSKLVCLCWVKKAYELVTREVIIKSFEVCGISVSVDGKEDHTIHCIKDDSSDPFADLDEFNEEDEDQVEANECVIESLNCNNHITSSPRPCFLRPVISHTIELLESLVKNNILESSQGTCPTVILSFNIATSCRL